MIYVVYGRENYIPSRVVCRDLAEAERFKRLIEEGRYVEEHKITARIEREEEDV